MSIFVSTIIVLLLASCSFVSDSSKDVLTQKKSDQNKIPITISLKYSVNLDEFEKEAEKKFPSLNLIQVGNFTSNYSDEYAQQLANDDLTDIVITWPLDQAALNCEDRLIDLSGKDFTSRYNLSVLNSISQDGKLYYLPGPTALRGILFNKTMFVEHGWEVPTNFDEFVNLCKQIESSGIRSLQLSFWNKEVLRYAFMGFGFGESFSSPSALKSMKKYRDGEGSLRDFALPAFDSFERMIDEGIFKPQDLGVRYPTREKMFYNRECAMISDSIAIIPAARKAGNNDEFQIMPFFCTGSSNSWGHLTPTQYIGLNKNLEKKGNEQKYNLALNLLDFISTQEGQLALSDGNTAMVSSLSDSPTPSATELYLMEKPIKNGRCTVFPMFTYSENALYDVLSSMLRGEITREEAIAYLDKENQNPSPPKKYPAIGEATQTFSLIETGNYVTDVMRGYTDTDIALFLDNGKNGMFNARGISAKFYKGDILESDVVQRILPTLQHGEKGYMNIVKMSGENLIKALDYTLDDGDWFYYFSGLKITYDPTAEEGSRVKSISTDKGNTIDPEEIYSVAIMEQTVSSEYINSTETTQILIKDLIIDDIKEKGHISPNNDGRFTF